MREIPENRQNKPQNRPDHEAVNAAVARSEPSDRKQIQGPLFGRAKLEAGSDVLVDAEADFTKVDLEQATTLHVHWGEPTAGVNDTALDGVGGIANAASRFRPR